MTDLRRHAADLLRSVYAQDTVLVAAHRGTSAGNIVQNTIRAFHAARRHGADIIECDVSMTSDGVLVVYHDGGERASFGVDRNIQMMDFAEVRSLRYVNPIGSPTDQRVQTLDEVLAALKGHGLINIDRGWSHWQAVTRAVDSHDMADQIILKSPAEAAYLEDLERIAPHMMFVPICRTAEDLERALRYDINLLGVEFVFGSCSDDVITGGAVQRVVDMGLLPWANAIELNERDVLAGGLDDVTSILDDPDFGWGRLVEMGFRIIQTDFPALLRGYLGQ